jgi:hypothetical protein
MSVGDGRGAAATAAAGVESAMNGDNEMEMGIAID